MNHPNPTNDKKQRFVRLILCLVLMFYLFVVVLALDFWSLADTRKCRVTTQYQLKKNTLLMTKKRNEACNIDN